jgi:hypothetical protein
MFFGGGHEFPGGFPGMGGMGGMGRGGPRDVDNQTLYKVGSFFEYKKKGVDILHGVVFSFPCEI